MNEGVLPAVLHDLLGREGSPAPLEDGPFQAVLEAARLYVSPHLAGSGNRRVFEFALFRAGVLAAVYGPIPARVYLSTMRWPPQPLRHLEAVRWSVIGNALVLAAAGEGRLAPGSRLPGPRAAVPLVTKRAEARREELAQEAAGWIMGRFAENGRAFPLGWEFRE